MRKIKRIFTLLLIVFVLASCSKTEKYEVDKTTTLKGKISVNEVKKDGETEMVSILELEKAITIDGVVTDKIEIEYDKSLKDGSETTITGTLKKNEGYTDLKYSITVDSIDNILSYVNNFSNDIFSVAIPPKLMKVVTVKPIKDGFIVSTADGNEGFKIIAVLNSEYDKNDTSLEKVNGNKKYTIVLKYPETIEETENIKLLYGEITNIKKSVKLK